MKGVTWHFDNDTDYSMVSVPNKNLCFKECLKKEGCRGATWQLNDIAQGVCFFFNNPKDLRTCHYCEGAVAPIPVDGVCNSSEDEIIDMYDANNELECIKRCASKPGECQFYSFFGEGSILLNKCMLLKTCADVTNAEGCPDIQSKQIQCFPPIQKECINYKELNDASRREDAHAGDYCDQLVSETISPDWAGKSWYRVTGEAGNLIPQIQTYYQRCGTEYSGYLNDSYPLNQWENKNGTVCFTDGENSCAFEKDIEVTNCGTYYVYLLDDVDKCNARYCTAQALSGPPQ